MSATKEKIVYIVTSGTYSDYGIEKVFLDKKKADLYCSCHNDCEIEEWEISDNMIITPMNELRVTVYIRIPTFPNKKYNIQAIELNNIRYSINRINQEEIDTKRLTFVHLGYDNITISLNRKTTDAVYEAYERYNIIPTDIKSKYDKVLQDILSQIKNVLIENDFNEWDRKQSKKINKIFKEMWK